MRMTVASTVVLLMLLTTVLSAQQADPLLGTWKLDPSRSNFPRADVPHPKQQTEIYREASGRIHLIIARTLSDGSSDPRELGWPTPGGIVGVEQGRPLAAQQMIIETHVGPGDWFVTYLRKGAQYQTQHKVISSDGKTMRQVIRGVDAKGQAFEQIQVFERQ